MMDEEAKRQMCLSLGISPEELSLDPTAKDLHSGDQIKLLSMKEGSKSTITQDTVKKSLIGSKNTSYNSPTMSIRTPDHRQRGSSLDFS